MGESIRKKGNMVKERQILAVAISVCLGRIEYMGMNEKIQINYKERNMEKGKDVGAVMKMKNWMPKNLQKICEREGGGVNEREKGGK